VLNRALHTAIRALEAVNAPIARWGLSFSALLLGVMLAVALAQILARALFNHTLDWAEDVARMTLVWSALLAAPLGYRSAGHVAITAFIEGLPPRLLCFVGILVNLLIGWICLIFLLESFAFVGRGTTITSTALGISMAWIYAVVPVALTALLLVSLEATLRLLSDAISGQLSSLLVGVVPVMQRDEER
jgi:TRAP-type C4-dicarboxylate transport system permease small subunit